MNSGCYKVKDGTTVGLAEADTCPFPLQLSSSRATRTGPPGRVEPIPMAKVPEADILEPTYEAADFPLFGSSYTLEPIRVPGRPSLFEPLSVRTSFCLETGQFQSPRSIIRTKTASPVWSPKKKAVVIAENPATGLRVSPPVFLQVGANWRTGKMARDQVGKRARKAQGTARGGRPGRSWCSISLAAQGLHGARAI